MRIFVLLCLLSSLIPSYAFTQQDSFKLKKENLTDTRIISDSSILARNAFVKDSLTYQYLKPQADRPNLFVENLLKEVIVSDSYLLTSAKSVKIKKNNYGSGELISKMPVWFFVCTLLLLVFFGGIKLVFKKQVDLIFTAFYNNRILIQLNKEDNVFVSWQFLFLFLGFSLTIGLFSAIILYKTSFSVAASDFYVVLLIALFAFVFFGLKILILRFLGFIFKVQKLTRDYTNVIYVTYFNVFFALLPITLCVSLINIQKQYYLFWGILLIFSTIIVFQFLRITINIILNYRLSKFYLILYLCILEICPILIFAKTINTIL